MRVFLGADFVPGAAERLDFVLEAFYTLLRRGLNRSSPHYPLLQHRFPFRACAKNVSFGGDPFLVWSEPGGVSFFLESLKQMSLPHALGKSSRAGRLGENDTVG